MNTRQTIETTNSSLNETLARATKLKSAGYFFLSFFLLMMLGQSALAQSTAAVRFTFVQDRFTVPLNSSNVTSVTNVLQLVNAASNANFTVTGLPAGATAVLTDTNGNAELSTAESTNLVLTLDTTNVAEGVYNFNVNVSGIDTNGASYSMTVPYVLQVAYEWNGTLNNTLNWSSAASWLGGSIPTNVDDVVFTDTGAQTNNFSSIPTNGIPFTNSIVDNNFTIASLRFAQTGVTNSIATNPPPIYHHVHIAAGKTLTITGTNGLTMMRDAFDDASAGLNNMRVDISGDTGAKLVMSNLSANATVFVGGGLVPTLDMSNLPSLSITANRIGIGDYLLYPNYPGINAALNEGRDTNTYSGRPRQLSGNVYLATTNVFTSYYVDANNYTNVYSRSYPFTLYNNEQGGVGSSQSQLLLLGLTNKFLMDSVCFYGASGNGTTEFGISNGSALFRNTNGTSLMSVFTISDDGGTNEAASNMKGNVDFSGNNGLVDAQVDRFYVARDRVLIATNQTPNIQGSLTIGRGNFIANTAILGYQEHTKPDWTQIGGGQPYLNYCQGKLTVNAGGAFKVNNTLTLGYTTDTNSAADAEQYNTYGQVTVNSNGTVAVNSVVVDGNLNYYDTVNLRNNAVGINQGGVMIVTNTMGGNNYGTAGIANSPGLPGLPLDNLNISSGGVLTLFVNPSRTNAYVRTFTSSGTTPGTIRVASLAGVSTYPATIPLIAYSDASSTIFLAADMSPVAGSNPGVQGYILTDTTGKTINLFLTTNAPKNLIWTGAVNNNWDLTTANWVTSPGGVQTNFSMGDIVTFDDSSSRTNINITTAVVPNQGTNVGMTISNSVNVYTFSGSGAIAGTAKLFKEGTNDVVFSISEAGPMTVTAGQVDVNNFGVLGSTTLFSNIVLNINDGGIVNGLIETNSMVKVAIDAVNGGGTLNGLITLNGGYLVNDGTINAPTGSEMTQSNGAMLTNDVDGTMNLGGSNPQFQESAGSTFANFGTIAISGGRMLVFGLVYGNGSFYDPVNGPTSTAIARFVGQDTSTCVISPGAAPNNSIGNMSILGRLDLVTDNNPANTASTLLVEVDQANHVYDTLTVTKWNDIGCVWDLTNLNGSFSSGQTYTILVNPNFPTLTNAVDTPSIFPLMEPYIPGPGLEWNLTGVQLFGTVGITNCSMIWSGGNTASWDTNGTTGNWQSSKVYGDNQGAVFDDTATATSVTINTAVAPAGINTFTITNLLVSTNTFTNMPTFMPGIVVSNSLHDYTMTGPGKITGMTSIFKEGTGTLTMLASNDYTGGLILYGGTFAMTNVTAMGISGVQREAYDQVIIDNTDVKYYGVPNVSFGRFVTINQDGGTFEVSSNGTELTLSSSVVGSGSLTKTGVGTLVLNQTPDTYSGGTVVNQGIVRLTAAAAGTGGINMNTGTTLQLLNAMTITNPMSVSGAVGVTMQGVATDVWSAPWSGTGNVTFASTNSNNLFVFAEGISGLNGNLSFGSSSNAFRFNNKTNNNDCTGSASVDFNLGTGSATLYNFSGAGLTYNLGSLAGGAGTTLSGAITNAGGVGTSTYSIGADGTTTTFAGKIQDGSGGAVTVTKVGSGTLYLDGNNTYSGATTVSAGTLSGVGSIAGNLALQSTGTLDPGDTTGTFTVGGTANLAGAINMELNQANASPNDMLSVVGAITATGSLLVTNAGPDITNGTVFHLFNKAVSGLSVTLPPTDPAAANSYTWQNNITTDGSIKLISGGVVTVNPNPTNIVTSVSSGVLTLSWPADHTGWILQAQTNPLTIGISNDWFNVAGSSSTNVVNMIMDPNNGTVFYRMLLQP
ncbi:MAG TPA: autotransporter-associated beta strand repeat-containing protein [Verrucomicrobiae bacterium]|jgi:autotransporter-associated beta strand protein